MTRYWSATMLMGNQNFNFCVRNYRKNTKRPMQYKGIISLANISIASQRVNAIGRISILIISMISGFLQRTYKPIFMGARKNFCRGGGRKHKKVSYEDKKAGERPPYGEKGSV